MPHLLALQLGLPCVAPGHGLPQAPQFTGSRVTSTHAAEQFCVPFSQSSRHLPPLHTSPLAHLLPHAPQLAGSVAVVTQRPEHSAKPVLHSALHLPLAHWATPLAGVLQAPSQPPQCRASLRGAMKASPPSRAPPLPRPGHFAW